MRLSIIIPTYKSTERLKSQLPPFKNHLEGLKIAYELIVVDDGSDDGGAGRQLCETLGFQYIVHEKNMGKGAAVRTGMLAAQGQYRIFTDADIPFSFDSIDRMLHYLELKESDIVTGDRSLQESVYFSEISKRRNAGSKFFSLIVGWFFNMDRFDTQCGLKGFSAKAALDIFSLSRIDSFAFDVEALYIAWKRKYKIQRMPVTLRNQDGSSVSLLRHALPMLFDLFRIKWNYGRGRYEQKVS